MSHHIVVTRPLVGAWREILEEAGGVELVGDVEGPDLSALRRAVGGADALVCLLTDRVDRSLIEVGERLRVIGNCAVGVDNIDTLAARERGIVVCHTPGILTEATADLTLALLLAVARRVIEGDRLVREGGFTGWRPDLLLGMELRGGRLGLLGLGRIGQAVARRAVSFGMEVVYWDRGIVPEAAHIPASALDLPELLATSDVVSIHLPLTDETRGLLDGKRMALMKPGAILINTARGAVVEEAALVRALRSGALSGAGLDVFEEEPRIHPGLLEADNAVLLPHIGSATRLTRARMAEGVCRDVVRVLEGEAPLSSYEASTP